VKTPGKQITEFVGLRATLYCYRMDEHEEKKCKGVKKNVIKKNISFGDYKRCLFEGTEIYKTMNMIRSRHHELYTEEINKVALSRNDDKRIIQPDRIHTHSTWPYSVSKMFCDPRSGNKTSVSSICW
jgi:hypothetical protein